MRKYIYTFVMLLLLGACTNSDLGFEMEDPSATDGTSCVTVLENGDLDIELKLQIDDMADYEVDTRSACVGNEGNIIDGWAFVFGTATEGTVVDGITYGDDSQLLQKVAFKRVSDDSVFFTLSPTDDPCFIRLMVNVTDKTEEAIANLTAGSSTFADYKNISVSLMGYYNISYDDLFNGTAIPDPNSLRTKKSGYPAASPGYAFPEGISSTTIDTFNLNLDNSVVTMVPVGSKVTVGVDSGCDFELQEVYALNVAKRAMMRSTVLENDGTTVASYDVPTNFGGTTKTAAVEAVSNSTVNTPIYIFPNEGDSPFTSGFAGQTDILGIDIENSTAYPASGVDGLTNPTYIIVKGKAEGYTVDGYYKIALINKTDDYTYDIIRDGHYQVNIYDVDNAGYRTAAEAEAGPSSEISYDVTIGASDDCRNIIKVSNNGLFSTEFDANTIYAQGYGEDGIDVEFQVKLTDNDAEDNFFTSSSTANVSVFSGAEYITLDSGCESVTADGAMTTIKFNVKGDGIVRLTCGDLIQDVRVYYEPLGATIEGGAITTSAGALFTSTVKSIEDLDDDGSLTTATDMISMDGEVLSNSGNYTNRECRATFYRANGSGITKVYLRQASDFVLNTSYDNSSAGSGGGSGTNNIFSTTSVDGLTSTYTADIAYQSTGKVYQVNSVTNGTLDSDGIMTGWTIGDAPIDVTTYGEFTTELTGSISTYFTNDDWSDLSNGETATTVTLDASDIETNQGAEYDEDKAEEHSDVVLTLTNIAGQTKVYNLNLAQYARPYIEDEDVTYDSSTKIYSWTCPLVADIYGLSSSKHNKGEVTYSPTVYNARYRSGEEGVGDWSWSEAPDSGSGLSKWNGGSIGVTRVTKVFNITSDPETNGIPTTSTDYCFRIEVVDYGATYRTENYQAYFDLDMSNGAAERIFFRILLRRDDDSQ